MIPEQGPEVQKQSSVSPSALAAVHDAVKHPMAHKGSSLFRSPRTLQTAPLSQQSQPTLTLLSSRLPPTPKLHSSLKFQHRHKPFVFISTFKWELRKGWDRLVEAFLAEFSSQDNVELYILTKAFMAGR